MLFKKLIRTFFKYKAQFISMIIMVILGVGIFAGFNAEWYSIEQDTNYFFEKTNLADYQIYNSKKGFSENDLNKILEIEGVSKASRFVSLDTNEARENDVIKLNVSENFTVSSFMLIAGEEYDATDSEAIWLSEKYANKNNYKIGEDITLSYMNYKVTLKIKGICLAGEYLVNTHGSALMPDFDAVGYAYTTPAFYTKMTDNLFKGEYYPQINVISSLEYETFSMTIDEKLNTTLQVIKKEDSSSYSKAMGEADEGKTIGLILPVIFLLIAILTMVTTMNRIISNEKRQIGILKALGFKNKRIVWHYTTYALVVGLLGSVIGLGLGYGIAKIFFSPSGSMGTYFEMPNWQIHMPYFVYIGTILIVAFLTLIGFLSVKQQLKGSAAEALRPYEPKKMKKFLMEKTKLFHKLNFATRYNLRDSARHKARTFVSIFGVFGCTLLLFATFGMRSTMDNYLDINYNVIMNYESSITLSEATNNERAISLAKDYDADYSATTACKVNGKTYALTVLNNDTDKVRLIKKNAKISSLANDGAYICERMADSLKLKKGDSFEFTLFGSALKYKATVIEIVSSSVEGFTINEEFAKDLALSYKVDTLYTNHKANEITTNNEIASILSKKDIIKTFDTFMEIMNLMIYVLIIFSVLLAFVVLYNLGTLSYVERYRELATLKVLGFKNKKIRWILISQNNFIAFIGILLGIPAGYFTLVVLFKALASEYELTIVCNALAYILSIIITFGVSLVVSYFASQKVKKINMVEALKEE